MGTKVLLILVDGMRPDAIPLCRHPFLSRFARESTHTMRATTVMPSVTLPCHTSLFFSVNPDRHGITTNCWTPMVRPIDGLADVVAKSGKKAAFFYDWEELRDLARPGSLRCSYYLHMAGRPDADSRVTDKAIEYINEAEPDFVFLYLGQTDEGGHAFGWMGEEYLKFVAGASACIERITGAVEGRYSVVVTADHGGHGRCHGTDSPEDMTIPIILHGDAFAAGKELPEANIKDIAPTIAELMELPKPKEWEGKSLL